MLQTPGEVAQQPFGLFCVVLVPGLTERLLDARVQMLGQALDGVAALVDHRRDEPAIPITTTPMPRFPFAAFRRIGQQVAIAYLQLKDNTG